MLQIEELSFAYPGQEDMLKEINLSVRQGEFLVLCGISGSGKTTLLRQIKPEIRPYGRRSGRVVMNGQQVEALNLRQSASSIGYVSQSADNQVVTDKVWHELAFGLESLGVKESEIRNRTAEMASFFGMSSWFHQNVSELSGGQLQKLCLASVLVMKPDCVLLDEPVSKLDPIAAYEFIQLLSRINQELNITIIMTEHSLKDVFYYADRIIYMEDGRIKGQGKPYEMLDILAQKPIFQALPVEIQTAYHYGFHQDIANGHGFREAFSDRFLSKGQEIEQIQERRNLNNEVLRLEHVYYSYTSKIEFLRDISLRVNEGDCIAILGANGCGKSTLLGIMAGLHSKFGGKRKCKVKTALLTQDVQTMFVKKSVREDLALMESEREEEIIKLFEITSFLEKHPYDLSGGEQQLVAIAKLFMTDAQIYLLDEPTKGMDCVLKERLAKAIAREREKSRTFLIVSHDLEFCARYTDHAMMLFDGEVMGEGRTREILLNNSFYTTALNRLLEKEYSGLLLEEDVERFCFKK